MEEHPAFAMRVSAKSPFFQIPQWMYKSLDKTNFLLILYAF